MAGADPVFLAGSFATDLQIHSGAEGERGTYRYFGAGYWDISIEGHRGQRVGRRRARNDECAEPAALSLVLPRHSTFLGRGIDDWQMDAGWPITSEGGSWIVSLTNMEAPGFKGTLRVDTEMYVITRVELGPMVQTLTIDRTEPTDKDLADLERLKSTVKHFRGTIQPPGKREP
jgi:hypothetical protein